MYIYKLNNSIGCYRFIKTRITILRCRKEIQVSLMVVGHSLFTICNVLDTSNHISGDSNTALLTIFRNVYSFIQPWWSYEYISYQRQQASNALTTYILVFFPKDLTISENCIILWYEIEWNNFFHFCFIEKGKRRYQLSLSLSFD